jgi:hypothetical protein
VRSLRQCEPEQIFNIIEAKIVDEYGNETDQRRIGPEAWNEVFRAQMESRDQVPDEHSIPKSTFNAPNKLRQMAVFFRRDVVAKLVNRQYVLINLIEAPALALVMAFFLRYAGTGLDGSNDYVYRQNDNIPQYLFISGDRGPVHGPYRGGGRDHSRPQDPATGKIPLPQPRQLPAQQDQCALHYFRCPEPPLHPSG